jgi:hypothetical protein
MARKFAAARGRFRELGRGGPVNFPTKNGREERPLKKRKSPLGRGLAKRYFDGPRGMAAKKEKIPEKEGTWAIFIWAIHCISGFARLSNER